MDFRQHGAQRAVTEAEYQRRVAGFLDAPSAFSVAMDLALIEALHKGGLAAAVDALALPAAVCRDRFDGWRWAVADGAPICPTVVPLVLRALRARLAEGVL